MDRYEFSVAMHLIRTVMAGIPLPPSLPDSMKVDSLSTTSVACVVTAFSCALRHSVVACRFQLDSDLINGCSKAAK